MPRHCPMMPRRTSASSSSLLTSEQNDHLDEHIAIRNGERIPKGFRPNAQGCGDRATLGTRERRAEGVAAWCVWRVDGTPSGLAVRCGPTQGSSFLATLG